jgi:peptidoglycan hydrolase-like protein with peptidoglycan-binding domain
VDRTGVVSDRTAKAVARYQRRLGLDPTGVVGADTWTALQQGLR